VNVDESAEDVEHLVTCQCGLRDWPATEHASIVTRLSSRLKMAKQDPSGSSRNVRDCLFA
jgi:hypothetical protein